MFAATHGRISPGLGRGSWLKSGCQVAAHATGILPILALWHTSMSSVHFLEGNKDEILKKGKMRRGLTPPAVGPILVTVTLVAAPLEAYNQHRCACIPHI